MALYQPSKLFGNIPCSGTGHFALGGKVTKTPPGTPRSPFCLIGRYQRRYPVATELLQGRWPLVIGQASRELRLTALGLMGVSCCAKKQIHLSRQKGVSRSRTSNPAEIRCQRIWFSGCAAAKLMASNWEKESKTLVLALFRFTFVRTKVNPSETKQRRGPLPGGSAAQRRKGITPPGRTGV